MYAEIKDQIAENSNIPDIWINYIEWLNKRIKSTEKELATANELDLKIGKGAKLCVYKECLYYIKNHQL